jgi:hypothetical protein
MSIPENEPTNIAIGVAASIGIIQTIIIPTGKIEANNAMDNFQCNSHVHVRLERISRDINNPPMDSPLELPACHALQS